MIKIHVIEFPEMDGLGFYFLRYSDHDTKREVGRVNSEGYLEFEKLKEGYSEKTKPTFFISGYFQQDFLKAVLEHMENKGFKTDKDAKIEGTLIATRYHLEDLRKLLKLEVAK